MLRGEQRPAIGRMGRPHGHRARHMRGRERRHVPPDAIARLALWVLGTVLGEVVVRSLEPEIQLAALAPRRLIGL